MWQERSGGKLRAVLKPTCLEELFFLLDLHPEALAMAGGTDLLGGPQPGRACGAHPDTGSGVSAIFFYLKQFGAGRGIATTSFFFTISSVVMILARLLGGWLFDRYSKVLLCIAGLFAAAVSYALLPVCTTGSMFFILAGFSGLGWCIAMPLQASVMFDISTVRVRGMNQNLLVVMMQGGFFLGRFSAVR